MSTIEWTDETWNPTVGCSKVSPGCDGCYAINVAHRGLTPAHQGLTIKRPGERPDWTGEVRQVPDRLHSPLLWRKPRRIFVDSMSDLFHPEVPVEYIEEVLAVAAASPRHTYQILTKRPQRMREVLDAPMRGGMVAGAAQQRGLTHMLERIPMSEWWPLRNVWLGTSIESDRYAFRADHLRATPAAVRFLSLEPLLGPLPSLDLTGIDWVIIGGESGPGARPMHPEWVRDIRDRCVEAGVAFFFKQWGAWAPTGPTSWSWWPDEVGQLVYHSLPRPSVFHVEETLEAADRVLAVIDENHAVQMVKANKHANGRELDGRTWDEMPAVAP
jgi:protein gp37